MACFAAVALLGPAGLSRGATGASSISLPERSSDPSLSLQGFPFVVALVASFLGLKSSFACFIVFFPSAISSNSSLTSVFATFLLFSSLLAFLSLAATILAVLIFSSSAILGITLMPAADGSVSTFTIPFLVLPFLDPPL